MFHIYRKSGHVRTAYDARDLVHGIKQAKALAKSEHQSYVVCYPSAAPIVTATPSGALHWS